jgi:hypothetical protein
MAATFLSPETLDRVRFLFALDSQEEAIRILDQECSQSLPFLESASPVELQRFHYAALKLSNGNLTKLKESVRLANQDWRDLLVAAGFANSTEAHLQWQPRKRDKKYNTAEQDAAANP